MTKAGFINNRLLTDAVKIEPANLGGLFKRYADNTIALRTIDDTGWVGWWCNDIHALASIYGSSNVYGANFLPFSSSLPLRLLTRNTYNYWYGVYGQNKRIQYEVRHVQTVDATPTDLLSIPVAEGENWLVKTHILAQQGETNRALYARMGLFYRNTLGNVTQQGKSDIILPIESNAAWDGDLIVDVASQAVDVRVTGAAVTIDWLCWTEYFKTGDL